MKFLLLLTLLLSSSLFAVEAKPLKACGEYAAIDLAEEHAEWTETFHMINQKGEVVGVYSYRDNEIHAAVCDYLSPDEEFTAANEWYYWDNENLSANPAAFKKGVFYRMSQDEGQAVFSVNQTSKAGEVSINFDVIGFDAEGDDYKLRTDVLTLKKIF